MYRITWTSGTGPHHSGAEKRRCLLSASQWPRRAGAVVQRPGGWTTDGLNSTQSLEAWALGAWGWENTEVAGQALRQREKKFFILPRFYST